MSDDEPPSNYELISEINDYYENLLGYSVKNTKLKQLDEKEWNSFCDEYQLIDSSYGIYLPRTETAVIPKENYLSLFHEYFGHGLFCEQSLIGKQLVDLEKKLLSEEKQEFKNKKVTLKDVEKFREGNKTFCELKEIQDKNLSLFERFAIFSEYFLSREFNQENLFEKKYESLSKQNKEGIENVINFNQTYGDLATFYNFGLARMTTPERVKKLLGDIYKNNTRNIKFATLYGSRKEFSDMDVFIVSENLPRIDSSWLDIRVEKEKKFKKMIKNFDVSIIGPVLNSEYLIGDKEYFEKNKNQLLEQPISNEAVMYNVKKTEEQKKFALDYPENSPERKHGFDYVNSYLKNASALKDEKRIFTTEELIYSKMSWSMSYPLLEKESGNKIFSIPLSKPLSNPLRSYPLRKEKTRSGVLENEKFIEIKGDKI